MTIENGDILYRYVRPGVFPEGQHTIPPGLFNDPALSCDWNKLCPKPEDSFHIEEGKTIIIAIKVCEEIRNPKNPKRSLQVIPEWKQDIIHDPIKEDLEVGIKANEAHSMIVGKKKIAVTTAIAENSSFYFPDINTTEEITSSPIPNL